jgi:hypothetical protein
METKFEELLGKTIIDISGAEIGSEDIVIKTADGSTYRMFHLQDCCESVEINDICGDVNDLIGSPILLAEEVNNDETPEGIEQPSESYTWTFYKLSTIKGSVTIRWLGQSNGYYSESVSFYKD